MKKRKKDHAERLTVQEKEVLLEFSQFLKNYSEN